MMKESGEGKQYDEEGKVFKEGCLTGCPVAKLYSYCRILL